jgi:hypothetical protein
MFDIAGLARIADAFLRAFGQAEMVVYCLEQNGACVGTAVRLIKSHVNGSVKMCSEQYGLCDRSYPGPPGKLACGTQLT